MNIELINSFKDLGLYESKTALAEYALSNYELKIPKNLSFDNMVSKLKSHVDEIRVPEPDVKPVSIFEQVRKFEMTANTTNEDELDSILDDIKTDVASEPEIKTPKLDVVEPETLQAIAADIRDANYKALNDIILPPDFTPCFVPMGSVESFYPLSYWINDWIQEHKNWKEIIHEYPRVQEHKFLYTLLYYIKKEGQFTIRETRNGEYITLN